MSTIGDTGKRREEIAIDYFRRVDAGDPTVIDLFTQDAQMFYPKFGFARGRAQIGAFAQGLNLGIATLQHEIEGFTVLSSGNYVVVEGAENGTTRSGVDFPDGVTSFGLFCNVFEFQGDFIKRLHIYVDPDFAGTHDEGAAWGRSVQDGVGSL
ncbi:nuclear transport factor 2 family protein [Promicromonospora sp. NPDC050249]|uniref:nuclear transport factor 2 family protein n=1 Tax=Promicromonospora sp. NPDC050249 TaxID=3154743 RepID=UPI0033D8AC69